MGGDDQLWRSGRGAIAGCHIHCREEGAIAIVVCYGGGRKVTANFGGGGGAIARVPL